MGNLSLLPRPCRPALLAAIGAGLAGTNMRWLRTICVSQMDVKAAFTFSLVMRQLRRV